MFQQKTLNTFVWSSPQFSAYDMRLIYSNLKSRRKSSDPGGAEWFPSRLFQLQPARRLEHGRTNGSPPLPDSRAYDGSERRNVCWKRKLWLCSKVQDLNLNNRYQAFRSRKIVKCFFSWLMNATCLKVLIEWQIMLWQGVIQLQTVISVNLPSVLEISKHKLVL